MRVLITAPNLDTNKNVSGISTVVNTIIENNPKHTYFHYLLGRPDKVQGFVYLFVFIKQLLYFPVVLRREKIDLVHQNLPFDPKGLMRESIINFWCYIFKVPVLLHVHGGEFLMNENPKKLWQYLSSVLFKHSRQVLVLSELEKEALTQFHGFDSSIVLSNSIAVEKYMYEERSTFNAKAVFLFLGRLHESKGLKDIYEAFVQLKSKSLKFRFILCGSGPLEQYCVESFEKLLGEEFDFRGVVSGADKLKVFREADFFLLPSRYGEGLPMALLEAMASGLVPIVTDDASMKFVVTPFVNGVRVNKRDGKDIAEKITQLLGRPCAVRKFQAEAIRTVREAYDIGSYILKLNEVYEDNLSKGRSHP